MLQASTYMQYDMCHATLLLVYYQGDNNRPEHLLNTVDPFPKILSFLSLNPGVFSIQDAPPNMSNWDDNKINPRLDFLLNQIGELALRHTSVRARLLNPDPWL